MAPDVQSMHCDTIDRDDPDDGWIETPEHRAAATHIGPGPYGRRPL